jgi:hypothetical protein
LITHGISHRTSFILREGMIMTRKRILLAFVLSIFVTSFIVPPSLMAAVTGRFVSVVGDVKQISAGLIITPMVNSPISQGDIISTGAKSEASLLFNDESTIKIAENSKFEVRWPEFFGQEAGNYKW